jgi:hypothetical protein
MLQGRHLRKPATSINARGSPLWPLLARHRQGICVIGRHRRWSQPRRSRLGSSRSHAIGRIETCRAPHWAGRRPFQPKSRRRAYRNPGACRRAIKNTRNGRVTTKSAAPAEVTPSDV